MFRAEGASRIFRSSGASSRWHIGERVVQRARRDDAHDPPVGRRPGAARSHVGSGTLVIDDDRIARHRAATPRAGRFDGVHVRFRGHYIVPGFIDVHVHGVEGPDTLDERGRSIAAIAGHLPRYGVTAFCPTSVACAPDALRGMLQAVRRRADDARAGRRARAARAPREQLHQSRITRRAQPLECLRRPPSTPADPRRGRRSVVGRTGDPRRDRSAARPDVGIVTIAPELPARSI